MKPKILATCFLKDHYYYNVVHITIPTNHDGDGEGQCFWLSTVTPKAEATAHTYNTHILPRSTGFMVK